MATNNTPHIMAAAEAADHNGRVIDTTPTVSALAHQLDNALLELVRLAGELCAIEAELDRRVELKRERDRRFRANRREARDFGEIALRMEGVRS
jgi:hypothetical protein